MPIGSGPFFSINARGRPAASNAGGTQKKTSTCQLLHLGRRREDGHTSPGCSMSDGFRLTSYHLNISAQKIGLELTLSQIWTFSTITLAGALTAALIWLPLPGVWWHVIRGICYLPILLVGARYGQIAGLSAGVAASLIYAFAAGSHGVAGMAWLSVLVPDFALVGFLGGRFLHARSRFERLFLTGISGAWPRCGKSSPVGDPFDLNPLASIQSAASLLSEDDTPPAQRQELAGIISAECEHLAVAIKSLLQFGAAATQPQFSQTDFEAVIDAAIRELEFTLSGAGIQVGKKVLSSLPPVECDPDQIRNLLIILAITTIQSLPAGSAVVLAAQCTAESVMLDIKDQNQHSFLSRFLNRLSGSRPATADVALAAAYDTVRRHGGKLRTNRNVRKGLEFSVWLPLRQKNKNECWPGTGGGG